MELLSMTQDHWPSVARIYEEGIKTRIATFETQVPDYPSWDTAHLKQCRLVAAEGDKILGWAALSPVSGRCVYGGVAEVSIYIAAEARGRGLGQKLLRRLIRDSEAEGIWTLQSGIFPQNKGSIVLHEKSGFRFLGKREKIGKRDGVWHDNLIYERRSQVVGID